MLSQMKRLYIGWEIYCGKAAMLSHLALREYSLFAQHWQPQLLMSVASIDRTRASARTKPFLMIYDPYDGASLIAVLPTTTAPYKPLFYSYISLAMTLEMRIESKVNDFAQRRCGNGDIYRDSCCTSSSATTCESSSNNIHAAAWLQTRGQKQTR